MRTETIKIYKFEELEQVAKEKAIENYRDINTDNDFWYDGTYETFKETMNDLGFDVEKMYFSGFWSQGDGAMFEGEINCNIKYRLEEIKDKEMKSSRKNWDRVMKLIKDGFITFNGNFHHVGRYYHRKSYEDTLGYDFECDYGLNLSNIEDVIDDMLNCIREIYEEHCMVLYRNLNEDYDYYTSDEAVSETIKENDYEFTKDGELF